MKRGDEGAIIVAYIPVLHEGYRRFFDKHPEIETLNLIGEEIIKDFKPLTKDIRALPPNLIKISIAAWGRFKTIEAVEYDGLKKLNSALAKVIMPDEDIMRELHEKYLPKANVSFDSIFLRWDKHKSTDNTQVNPDHVVSKNDSDKEIIQLLRKEAEKSSDWWRHIGAAVVKDGKVILIRHNHTVPDKHLHYVEGDPRCDFHKGVNIELSTILHAEAGLIADAARQGISLEGAEMFITTFPCPPCAKLIAYSGIKRLYYADGYGVLDGERVLKEMGVEIIFVKADK